MKMGVSIVPCSVLQPAAAGGGRGVGLQKLEMVGHAHVIARSEVTKQSI
jgi:hypothetical protein